MCLSVCLQWGVHEIISGQLDKGGRKAAQVLNAVGVNISCYPLFHAARAHLAEKRTEVRSPIKNGGSRFLSAIAIEKLHDWVAALRAMRIKVGRSLVVGTVKVMVKGTELEEKFADDELASNWYKSFKVTAGFRKDSKPNRIELSRAKWCTAKNVKLYVSPPLFP